MTMFSTPPLNPLIRWAQQQLNLSAEDSSPARRQFLTNLPANGFVPSAREQQAIYVLIDDHVPRAAAALARLAEEQRLRETVESFAASYFDTPPEQRRLRWQDLHDQCQMCPPLGARLDHLSLALDVAGPAGDGLADQLAAHFCRLYVMPSHPRAMERQKLLWEMARQWDDWRAAFRQLVLLKSPYNSLEPRLHKRLLDIRRPWLGGGKNGVQTITSAGTSGQASNLERAGQELGTTRRHDAKVDVRECLLIAAGVLIFILLVLIAPDQNKPPATSRQSPKGITSHANPPVPDKPTPK